MKNKYQKLSYTETYYNNLKVLIIHKKNILGLNIINTLRKKIVSADVVIYDNIVIKCRMHYHDYFQLNKHIPESELNIISILL